MNKTEHFGLSQWDPSDRILREDFNRDNKTIDDALAPLRDLDAGLLGDGGLGAALAAKSGKLELIVRWETDGRESGGTGYLFPKLDWDQWSWVAMLVHYTDKSIGDSPSLSFSIYEPEVGGHKYGPLAQPGYLVVFLPFHVGDANLSGFIVADHLIPFSYGFPFRQFSDFQCLLYEGSYITTPTITFFGCK